LTEAPLLLSPLPISTSIALDSSVGVDESGFDEAIDSGEFPSP
jgi:hypothetical protein